MAFYLILFGYICWATFTACNSLFYFYGSEVVFNTDQVNDILFLIVVVGILTTFLFIMVTLAVKESVTMNRKWVDRKFCFDIPLMNINFQPVGYPTIQISKIHDREHYNLIVQRSDGAYEKQRFPTDSTAIIYSKYATKVEKDIYKETYPWWMPSWLCDYDVEYVLHVPYKTVFEQIN